MIVVQLEQALTVAEKDTKDASEGVMKDLRRFQSEKENDVRRYMVSPPFLLSFFFCFCTKVSCVLTPFARWSLHSATSTGRVATRPRGKKPALR